MLPQNEMIPGIFTRSSLRGWGLQHCHSLQFLVQQPQPLINLRSFSLNTRPTSVLVRAQAIAATEQTRPNTHSFNQLGLGEELLNFLAEHNLHTPTEIQVYWQKLYFLHFVLRLLLIGSMKAALCLAERCYRGDTAGRRCAPGIPHRIRKDIGIPATSGAAAAQAMSPTCVPGGPVCRYCFNRGCLFQMAVAMPEGQVKICRDAEQQGDSWFPYSHIDISHAGQAP